MPQLSNLSELSLEKAASMVAFAAGLGAARVRQEKQAMHPGLSGALIGGGLGLGTGLLSSAMSDDPEKPWTRNAILGALLGAGVGGGIGMSGPLMKNISNTGETGDAIKALQTAKEQEIAARPPDHDIVGGAIRSLLPGSFTGSPASPEFLAEQAKKGIGADVAGPLAPNARSGLDIAGDYIKRPGDVAASGALGYGAGYLADQGLHKALARRVNTRDIRNLSAEQVKGLGGNIGAEVTNFQNMAKAPGASVMEAAGKNGPGVLTPRPGGPATIHNVPLNQWREMQLQHRNQFKPPRIGRLTGGALGIASAPAVSRTFSRMFGQKPIEQPIK